MNAFSNSVAGRVIPFAFVLLGGWLGRSDLVAQTTPEAYAIIDLGTLGGTASQASAINAQGQVCGTSYSRGNQALRPFVATGDGNAPVDLGSLGGDSQAVAINASGDVAGDFVSGVGERHAFIYRPGEGLTDLNLAYSGLTDPFGLTVTGLNASGQVVGVLGATGGARSSRGFIVSPGAGVSYLASLSHSQGSAAFAINDAGQIAGAAPVPAGTSIHAVRFENGGTRAVDLGTLPGGNLSYGYGINDAGTVVGGGTVNVAGTVFHAFLCTSGGGMVDLGTVDSFNSFAQGINHSGQVVGNLHVGDPASNPPVRPFLHTSERGMVDLNTLLPPGSGWTLQAAFSINDAGQMVGYGLHAGQTRPFLLTPANLLPSPGVSVVGAGPSRRGFVLSRTGSTAQPVTVLYHNGGSANRDVDYVAFSGSATIPAGQSETVIPVQLLPGANRAKKVKVILDPAPDGISYAIAKAQSKVFLNDL